MASWTLDFLDKAIEKKKTGSLEKREVVVKKENYWYDVLYKFIKLKESDSLET